MKKRVFAFLFACILTLTGTALAYTDSVSNFTRHKTYVNQFSDLSSGSTFYSNVTALYEYGLSVGKTNGSFGLHDSVNVSQVIIFAARIHSLYRTGDPEAGAEAYRNSGTEVYQPYLLYLQREGVLGDELSGTYYHAATRAQVAHILANALPSSALPEINRDVVTAAYQSGKFITDVTSSTAYAQDILTLYACGISQGSNASGSYFPSTTISRGALAAMLTRMVDPGLRITVSWDLSRLYSAVGTTWSNLVSDVPVSYTPAPLTTAEIKQDVAYMLWQGENMLVLEYPEMLSHSREQVIVNSALTAVRTYCEQSYNQVESNYDAYLGQLVLHFSAISCSDQSLSAYRDYTLSAAIATHDQLWASGAITADMTEYEKAKVYYTWICEHCTYDSTGSLSHLAYSLFKDGTAVCDGYTGAYNLLLKLEGIDCYALSNSSHIWTVATLDGTLYHIDTTWGDGSDSAIDYSFFAMSAATSWRCHRWPTTT